MSWVLYRFIYALASGGRWPSALPPVGAFFAQIIGILSIGAFVFGSSMLLWFVIDRTLGLRVSRDVEAVGQDVGSLGIEAYSGVRDNAGRELIIKYI